MSQTLTLSALADKIEEVFTNVKREQPFFNATGCGDFYYYSFLFSMANNTKLEIRGQDLEPIKEYFEGLSIFEIKTAIQKGIEKFLIDNGVEGLFQTHIENRKLSWRIV